MKDQFAKARALFAFGIIALLVWLGVAIAGAATLATVAFALGYLADLGNRAISALELVAVAFWIPVSLYITWPMVADLRH